MQVLAASLRRAASAPVALVVAALMVVAACSGGGRDRRGADNGTSSSSATAGDAAGTGTAEPGASDVVTGEAPSDASAAEMESVTVYFPAADGEKLAGEERSLFKTPQPGDRAKQIVAALIEGPQTEASVRAIPESTELRQLFVLDDGTAWADFSAALRDNIAGGSATELLAVYSIVDSIVLNVPEIKRVGVLVEGRPIDTLNGHVDLRRPLKPRHDLAPTPPPPAE